MPFNKAVVINIAESELDREYWNKLAEFVPNKSTFKKGDPQIETELKDADCLLVGFGIEVTKDMIDKAPNLKYIAVLATAFGKIDIDYAKEKGIPVSNLAGYSTEAVAEFTIAAMLELARGLEVGMKRGRSGNYSEAGINAREMKDSTFGVIGLGSIGGRVAEIAAGFGANVCYWSRQEKAVPFAYKELDEVISESDFLSINLAQTPETEKILSADRINSLKQGAIVINTCPMELVDIDALATRLAKDDIYFALDHADETPKEDLNKLAAHPNCVIYPPIAYITAEARLAKQDMFIDNIRTFLEGEPRNVVNA